MEVYHASTTAHKPEYDFQHEDCGFYEKFRSDGTPVVRSFDEHCAISDTKQLAASKNPAGALFAVIKNIVNQTGTTIHTTPTQVSIYELDTTPDIDCSKSVYGDFALIEEVRVENPEKFPVHGNRTHTVEIPNQAYEDVELTYLPQYYTPTQIHGQWGREVKENLESFLQNGTYQSDFQTPRPVREAYIEA